MDSFKKMAGANLKKIRKQKGYPTQLDLATALGTNQNTVGRWEAGLNLPEGKYKEALCELLGVTWDELTDISETLNLSVEDNHPSFIRVMTLLATLNENEIRGLVHVIEMYIDEKKSEDAAELHSQSDESPPVTHPIRNNRPKR